MGNSSGSSAKQAVSLFSDLVSRDDSSINVPAAALAMARVQYPSLDIEAYLEALLELGAEAAGRLRGATGFDRITALNRFLFDEVGFRGNNDEYYDPRNSCLNDVLDRRLGIPITLSLVYIETGRACGLQIEGVGFPGHFLVREIESGELLDPFTGGAKLDAEGIGRLLAAQGISASEWRDGFIEAVTKRQMLLRMINNLGSYYSRARDAKRLAALEAMAEVLQEYEEEGSPSLVQ